MRDSGLEHAPDEIKLAVDLIYLLESHDVAPETVLKALAIVQSDFERKLNQKSDIFHSSVSSHSFSSHDSLATQGLSNQHILTLSLPLRRDIPAPDLARKNQPFRKHI